MERLPLPEVCVRMPLPILCPCQTQQAGFGTNLIFLWCKGTSQYLYRLSIYREISSSYSISRNLLELFSHCSSSSSLCLWGLQLVCFSFPLVRIESSLHCLHQKQQASLGWFPDAATLFTSQGYAHWGQPVP